MQPRESRHIVLFVAWSILHCVSSTVCIHYFCFNWFLLFVFPCVVVRLANGWTNVEFGLLGGNWEPTLRLVLCYVVCLFVYFFVRVCVCSPISSSFKATTTTKKTTICHYVCQFCSADEPFLSPPPILMPLSCLDVLLLSRHTRIACFNAS